MAIYCIVATKELDGDFIFRKDFEHEPTRDEILKIIMDEDFGYDDNYGKFEYFKIKVP